MAKFRGKKLAQNWNDVDWKLLNLINPNASLAWNASRLNSIDFDTLSQDQKNILANLSTFILDLEPLYEAEFVNDVDFNSKKFGQWVDTMIAIRSYSKEETNQFQLLYNVIEVFDIKEKTIKACQLATAFMNHCVTLAGELNKREFPHNPKLAQAVGSKFDNFEELNYIFALSGGDLVQSEFARNMTIQNATVALYYQHANAHFQNDYQQLLQSSTGKRTGNF